MSNEEQWFEPFEPIKNLVRLVFEHAHITNNIIELEKVRELENHPTQSGYNYYGVYCWAMDYIRSQPDDVLEKDFGPAIIDYLNYCKVANLLP